MRIFANVVAHQINQMRGVETQIRRWIENLGILIRYFDVSSHVTICFLYIFIQMMQTFNDELSGGRIGTEPIRCRTCVRVRIITM